MDPESVDTGIAVPDRRTSRQLFRTGLIAIICAGVWLYSNSEVTDPVLLSVGELVLILGALPALNWARKAEPYFPIFEMFMLTTIPFYAVPLLNGHRQLFVFSPAATWKAAIAMILFQLCAIAAFSTTRGRSIRSPTWKVSLLPTSAQRYAQVGIWLNTLYLYINGFTDLIPSDLSIVMRAIFIGIGIVTIFVEMRRWGLGQLPQRDKLIVGFNLVAQLILHFQRLFLIEGISVLLLALIGYVSTSRRVPIALLVFTFPILAVLHNGKSAMRQKYWVNLAPAPTVAELPAFFQEWVEHGLTPPRDEDQQSAAAVNMAGQLFERASLFQMLNLATELTPDREPYLYGESYRLIFAQLVPRPLWPDKPSSLLSNILLAVHYRLVSPDDTGSVSIAFGMIAEAFANFGLLGCALLGALLGYGYKRVCIAAVGQPQFSAIGLLTILVTAWSFQVEQIFATWIVSLIQAALVVVGGPLAFRELFGGE